MSRASSGFYTTMNIPAAIRLINEARQLQLYGHHSVSEIRLKEALAALQPQRYVLRNKPGGVPLLYLIDTQHPEYREDAVPVIGHPWVVLRWQNATAIEEEKARAIVEHLNSTATPHDNQT